MLGAGGRSGFNIFFVMNFTDLDYVCRGPVQGFKFMLHTPGEVPRVSKHFYRVPLQQEIVVSVKPNMMTTSESVRGYSPHGRQCYFDDEKYLKYFKNYTQSNCQLECLSNFTLSECGCVKFSMPRDSKMKICQQKDIKCYNGAENNLLAKELETGVTTSSDINKSGKTMCDCLPACTSINYDAEISQADFDGMQVLKQMDNDYASFFKEYHMSRLRIVFKEAQFLTSRRSELYGFADLVAHCGGLLGEFSYFVLPFSNSIKLIMHSQVSSWACHFCR